ncbi:hypothetical protein HKBW3S03_01420 [Candidatus Hakubella thermalkaliphila]|uniref:Uncharacterized protein n=1 Tax=Candidatus Hakubella thermalkaliphila TaxID=2754717 RepID=A0A6V8NN54_9ACTN|nr:hypothetical protein [Candidatus Hakubella thermalkaliphila]GFP19916.1 hypothetical protein HKBW3S03_01420 [Candidatus Hakubella thermalkaliphila]
MPAERIVIIPNGIILDPGETFSLGGLPFVAEVPLVGTGARLAPQKGVEHFLLAAKELASIFPELSAGFWGIIVGSVAAFLFNDSGVVAAATTLLYAGVPIILLAGRIVGQLPVNRQNHQ